MNNDLVSRKDVMTSIVEEYNKRWQEHGLKLAYIETAVNRTPSPWIPVYDGDGEMPPVDEEGYSDYIFLSFSNCEIPCIGQYRVDEHGGAFYDGDDNKPLISYGLVVNAWMPLPERYKGDQ